jgi:hypothetical protein
MKFYHKFFKLADKLVCGNVVSFKANEKSLFSS